MYSQGWIFENTHQCFFEHFAYPACDYIDDKIQASRFAGQEFLVFDMSNITKLDSGAAEQFATFAKTKNIETGESLKVYFRVLDIDWSISVFFNPKTWLVINHDETKILHLTFFKIQGSGSIKNGWRHLCDKLDVYFLSIQHH